MTHQLCAKTTQLGRNDDCDFVLVAHGVSRQHAQVVERDEETFVLEDLDSTNGTYVNGSRVANPHVLKDQDRIRIGQFLIRFEDGTSDIQPGPPKKRTRAKSEDTDPELSDIRETARGDLLSREGMRRVNERRPDLPPGARM